MNNCRQIFLSWFYVVSICIFSISVFWLNKWLMVTTSAFLIICLVSTLIEVALSILKTRKQHEEMLMQWKNDHFAKLETEFTISKEWMLREFVKKELEHHGMKTNKVKHFASPLQLLPAEIWMKVFNNLQIHDLSTLVLNNAIFSDIMHEEKRYILLTQVLYTLPFYLPKKEMRALANTCTAAREAYKKVLDFQLNRRYVKECFKGRNSTFVTYASHFAPTLKLSNENSTDIQNNKSLLQKTLFRNILIELNEESYTQNIMTAFNIILNENFAQIYSMTLDFKCKQTRMYQVIHTISKTCKVLTSLTVRWRTMYSIQYYHELRESGQATLRPPDQLSYICLDFANEGQRLQHILESRIFVKLNTAKLNYLVLSPPYTPSFYLRQLNIERMTIESKRYYELLSKVYPNVEKLSLVFAKSQVRMDSLLSGLALAKQLRHLKVSCCEGMFRINSNRGLILFPVHNITHFTVVHFPTHCYQFILRLKNLKILSLHEYFEEKRGKGLCMQDEHNALEKSFSEICNHKISHGVTFYNLNSHLAFLEKIHYLLFGTNNNVIGKMSINFIV